MKIALITDGIWPYVLGGMQKHSYYLCKYLASNKVEVHLVHFNQSAYNIRELEFFTEAEKQYIQSTVLDFPDGGRFPGHYLRRSFRYSELAFQAIHKDLDKYDFIYCKGFTANTFVRSKREKRLKMPPVGVNFHGYEMFQKAADLKTWLQYRFLLRAPVKRISLAADLVFSYGAKISGIIRELGVPVERIAEIPSGVESAFLSDSIRNTQSPIKFLFLGRYERRKGIEELNWVLRQFLNNAELPDFEMHFIGPIPPEKRIQHQKIVYHGEWRDKDTLGEKISACDILLCPSWSEGFPNVLVEAMACGLSVLATNVGAVSVLVNNRNGYLLEKAGRTELKTALIKILHEGPERIDARKKEALQTIREKFTWEKLSLELIALLNRFTGTKA
ncbi:MAG TPA: glycosyltransferase family 4 protein [Bacteroidia bacterium]|nr:glycosyltransferase family 4 protein [Bacteroidia bacterium]